MAMTGGFCMHFADRPARDAYPRAPDATSGVAREVEQLVDDLVVLGTRRRRAVVAGAARETRSGRSTVAGGADAAPRASSPGQSPRLGECRIASGVRRQMPGQLSGPRGRRPAVDDRVEDRAVLDVRGGGGPPGWRETASDSGSRGPRAGSSSHASAARCARSATRESCDEDDPTAHSRPPAQSAPSARGNPRARRPHPVVSEGTERP